MLKNKLSDLESQIKEGRKTNERLKAESDKKMGVLMKIESDITSETERFKWKREELLRRHRAVDEQNQMKLKDIKKQQIECNIELGSFDIAESENERLHSILQRHSSEEYKLSTTHHKEREIRKQKAFDTRMALEEILRKTITFFDNEYQLKAIEKMELEAQNAKIENYNLLIEHERREKQCDELIRKQQMSYDNYMKAKVQVDVLLASCAMHQHIGNHMLITSNELKREIVSLIQETDDLFAETLSLRKESAYKAKLMENHACVKGDLQKARKERLKTDKEVIKLCQKLVQEGLEISHKSETIKKAKLVQGFETIASRLQSKDKDMEISEAAEKSDLSLTVSASVVEAELDDGNEDSGNDDDDRDLTDGYDNCSTRSYLIRKLRSEPAVGGTESTTGIPLRIQPSSSLNSGSSLLLAMKNSSFGDGYGRSKGYGQGQAYGGEAEDVWKAERTDVHTISSALRTLIRENRRIMSLSSSTPQFDAGPIHPHHGIRSSTTALGAPVTAAMTTGRSSTNEFQKSFSLPVLQKSFSMQN